MSHLNKINVLRDAVVGENLVVGHVDNVTDTVTSLNTKHLNIRDNQILLNNGGLDSEKDCAFVANIGVSDSTPVAVGTGNGFIEDADAFKVEVSNNGGFTTTGFSYIQNTINDLNKVSVSNDANVILTSEPNSTIIVSENGGMEFAAQSGSKVWTSTAVSGDGTKRLATADTPFGVAPIYRYNGSSWVDEIGISSSFSGYDIVMSDDGTKTTVIVESPGATAIWYSTISGSWNQELNSFSSPITNTGILSTS